MDNTSVDASVKYCRHCGKELTEQSKFCSACGTKVIISKKPKKKTAIGIFAGIGIAVIAAVAVTMLLFAPTAKGNLTFNGPPYDPCDFMKNPSLFDKPLSYFLEDLTEGTDYEKKDLGQRVFYNIYLPRDFMKVGKNATLSFICRNDYIESPVGYARYYFYPEQGKSGDAVVYMVSVLEKTFGKATRYLFEAWDTTGDEFFAKLKEDENGAYTVHWETDQTDVSLTLYKSNDAQDHGLLQFYQR